MPSFDERTSSNAETYDVIIIGAGPCGLATASRLRERHPSALFTDEEHARFSWISARASVKNRRNGRVKASKPSHSSHPGPSILVLDESGDQWMTKWKTLFHKLEIPHLRSPMFFHPDPSDRDALLAFCHETGRTAEMQEITGCVGKEISKHRQRKSRARSSSVCAKPTVEINERDRRDYFTPSSQCFADFCDACISRYALTQDLLKHQVVDEVEYHPSPAGCETEPLFFVRTETSIYRARTVVIAIGAGEPIIPPPFPPKFPASASQVSDATNPRLFSTNLLFRIRAGKATRVLVVGGGLTGAQTVDACIRNGINKVWLLMRGHWKVKPFDVDLSWMSKFRNHQKSAFWNADGFEERMALIKEARDGGSMTSRASKLLKEHIMRGQLVVHTHTAIVSQSYDNATETWKIQTAPPVQHLPNFDHIFFTTGTKTDIMSMKMFQKQMATHPIRIVGGLPVLSENLAWSDDIPLFFAGKMAMLQLGPGAGNLEGARESAERISWAIEDVLHGKRSTSAGCDQADEECNDAEGYAMGIGNKFARLSDHM